MKKVLLLLLTMVVSLSTLVANGQTETAAAADGGDKKITLVYAEVNPLDSIVGQTGLKFKEELERLSNGTVTLDIQHSGVLGAENDVLDAMLGGGGTIDMSRISAFALTSYGGEKSKLLSIPYTFVNREHFWKFATSDLAPEFLLEPFENGTGIRGLFYGEEGFRHFFATKPLNSIKDLAGMKIRVSNDPVMRGLVQGLGASPTVVNYNELYSALQTGVVDAAEQPIANYKSKAFQEVAPYMILDGHTLGAIQVVITNEAWSELSSAQQNAMMEAGKIASAYNRKLSEGAENKVLEELAAEGVVPVKVADKGPFQKASEKVIKEASANNAALYKKILDMQ
ncbi:TRAP transporter substrate-binding protein [Oceanispirochaeta sp.]|jgi:tripartite ATP-independent transporter DctP family solute receptor|uniref:TRAP transporter substrate-binding protein n=1 Tax=Oceanispirochaeta sp. TaxID=2035350 RepID=UPI0026132297|nr:TRAP transporter substrate-binding protein [Oceanispirochaeta sp.]MDA3955693.1 TRAP transporter substrate-binding protein [Oceanispirochaeta sp.]